MGQILVRNLEDGVIERLKQRALKADKSLEQTVREILTEAAKPSREEILAETDRIREAIRKRHGGDIDFDITAAIRQDRDNDEPYR
jgi:plasmid stability protein